MLRKLRAVRANRRDLVRHDQMVLGIDGSLHIVADDAGTTTAGRHRAGIGISERDLLIGRGEELPSR